MNILVLGGTISARFIADKLARQGHHIIYSLAGESSQPKVPSVLLRRGGFGGVAGLTSYIKAEAISLLVDATHPFAVQISQNAGLAGAACGVGVLRYEREPWTPAEGDSWITCGNVKEAVALLPCGAKVFLAIGRKHIQPFLDRKDISGMMRMIEPPELSLPPNWKLRLARPPFSAEEEVHVLQSHTFSHLVCKNSGGAEGVTKLVAAGALGIQVVMISRPLKPGGIIVGDIDKFDNLKQLLAAAGC
jgi:precorrin-6A/cobalt-precorrin-6A reductase